MGQISDIIEGLQILQSFYERPNEHHIGANTDEILASYTETPLSDEALGAMISLGWYQEHSGRDYDKTFSKDDYREDEYWYFYT